MKQIAIALIILVVCGCASQRPAVFVAYPLAPPAEQPVYTDIVFEGGDGSSMEQAIIIKAPSNIGVVEAESYWIRKNHPGWRKGVQGLAIGDGKMYDQIFYTTPQGGKVSIYFEITDHWGK